MAEAISSYFGELNLMKQFSCGRSFSCKVGICENILLWRKIHHIWTCVKKLAEAVLFPLYIVILKSKLPIGVDKNMRKKIKSFGQNEPLLEMWITMWSKISNYCKNFLPIHFLNIAFIFIHNLWWVLCSDIRIFAWTVPTNKLYPLAPLQRLCPDLKPNLEGSCSKQKLTTILKLRVMKVFIRQLQSYFIIANF